MLWLVWHMWILLLLAFAGGLIAGWILRSRSDEAPQRAALAAPPAKPAADPEPSTQAPPAPNVPAPGPGAEPSNASASQDAAASGSTVAAAFTAPNVSEPEPKPKAKPAAKSAKSGGASRPEKAQSAETSSRTNKADKADKTDTAGKPAPAARTAKTGAGKDDAAASGDDLTAVKGLGPRAAEKLAEAGVTRLSQIADWSAADIEKYDALVNARGRIARDDWVGQAKALTKA